MSDRVEFKPVVTEDSHSGFSIAFERYDKVSGDRAPGTLVVSEMNERDLWNLHAVLEVFLMSRELDK